MDILKDLNPAQREAVESIEGPVLVLAGPGSGKTRVLTQRVGYLVHVCGINPYNIMAVTFTNKAAREMKERLHRLLGERLRRLTIGTFHAICVRILRREAEEAGLPKSFVIYDDGDQLGLIRQALKDLDLDDKMYQPRAVQGAISRAKNELVLPENYVAASYWHEVAGRVYHRYQELLSENDALDFDDILMFTAHLFAQHRDVLAKYQRRYIHILVDEFQDTN
ncbi:MAG: ATP-dependent helicase, partial [Anaerolineae bacterium]